MEKITILNVTEEGRGGGALFRLIAVSNVLRPDIRTIVVCPKSADEFICQLKSNEIEHESIRLHQLTKSVYGLLIYFISFYNEVRAISKLIKKHKPSVIHCNGSWQFKGIVAAWVSDVPAIWHMNDTHQPKIIRWIFSCLSGWATGYIYASKRSQNYYTTVAPALLDKPNWLIPAPIRNFVNIKANATILDDYQGVKVLTIGYINANKGIHQLIKTARLFKDKGKDSIHWFVAGPVLNSQSKYYAELQSLIAENGLDNFHFLGFQSDVYSLLCATDIYICPSSNESSPIAVWEALAVGKVVISNDVGDVKEIFEKEGCGICISNNEANQIANAIEEVLSQGFDNQTMKSKAVRVAKKLFHPISMKQKYIDAYKDLVI